MSNYTPYYEGGWKNEEEMTTTPICAEALNHMEEGISAAYDTDIGLYPVESASGDIAVIHDGAESVPVRDLSVAIEPVQSLNGYDKPWAGGAGKNLLLIDRYNVEANGITFTKNADGSITANGTATANAQIRCRGVFLPAGNYKFNGCPAGGNSETYNVFTWDYTTGARPKKWDGTTASAANVGTEFQEIKVEEGHEISINCRVMQGVKVTNIVFKPMIVKASETDATYEPYSNICPISGWDAVKVTRADGIVCEKNNSWANASGIVEASAPYVGYIFRCEQDKRYYYKFNGTAGHNIVVAFYTEYPNVGVRSYNGSRLANLPNNSSIVAPINGYGLIRNVVANPLINIGTVDSYEPMPEPVSDTHTITLPTTVYGGTLDVTKGVLTVDKGFVTWNGSEDWALSGGKRARCNIYALQNLIKRPAVASEILEGLQASYLTAQTDNATYQGTVGISCQTNGVVGITLTGEATTADAVKAYLAEHPLQVVYPLATPQTYTLTPTEIKTLLGENRFYADAGDVTVEYRVDFNEAGLMFIPKAPTADGSYRLTADVTGGTPTYRWEAAE